jgi:glycosyltransferase involved in cell wall biosynthesis
MMACLRVRPRLQLEGLIMRILIASDAWVPQVNGVVRSLEATIQELKKRNFAVEIIHPLDFTNFPMPGYADIRLAIARAAEVEKRLNAFRPDAIHIATEGPIGWATRKACLRLGLAFTTCYHTKFPEYLAARLPVPKSLSYRVLRHFHAPSRCVMVSTLTLRDELAGWGFGNLALWSRGVDTDLFHPEAAKASPMDVPGPIFLTVSRLAVEKNIEAFLALDLPGTKVVVGDGPQRKELETRFPAAKFLGMQEGPALAASYAKADCFVFPSLTDTYGMVLLEAAASGVPIAAYPVAGPIDVVGKSAVAMLDDDLRAACLAALHIPRETCRAFALTHSWASATDQFLANLGSLTPKNARGGA